MTQDEIDENMRMDDVDEVIIVHLEGYQVLPNFFKQRRKVKKSYQLQYPFFDPTKRKKLLVSKVVIHL